VIEQIEHFRPTQNRPAGMLDTAFGEKRDLGCRRPSKRRFADHFAVDHWSIVVRAVAVVVDSGCGIEWARRRELGDGAGGDVIRQAVAERDHRAMALIDHAWTALFLSEPRDIDVVRIDAIAVGERAAVGCGRSSEAKSEMSDMGAKMKSLTLLSVYLGFGALLAQQTTTERQAAREVIAKLESVERSIEVPGLVTRLTADDRDRDRVVARAKQLMESELLAMSDDITTR
jgi:hypothetical protein